MPDNLPAAASTFFALPDHTLVALDGPDATAFAQAQFANDVVALPSGHWQWNAWLTPKGRVIALFALLKLSEDRLLMVLPDYPASELVPALQRFVFRRKLKVSVPDALQAMGSFQPPDSAQSARIGLAGESIELDYGDAGQPRTLRVASLAEAGHAVDHAMPDRWFAEDLRAGLPRLPITQREQWTPQQLSLDRLHAFSVKKGCYPGQEIVARTHFLGKAKRVIVLLEGTATLEPGLEVSDGERAIGTIISASRGDERLAMAVLPLDRSAESLMANGGVLREVALRNGLAR